ncbi:MAG TPA: Zn-dependent hydrolase [Hyphomicrobiaceae bacterium]|nr:Zn-dependent hydrolase [Hyphomicrobiaceae bacterium]
MIATTSDIRNAVLGQRQEVASLFDALRTGSQVGDGITRDTYGAGEQFAHQLIAAHAGAMGLEIGRDHAANLHMTLAGSDRGGPRLMTGSHLDSVANGGNFDGAAGVLAGLVAIRALQQLGLKPSCDVTTVALRAEESVWFQVSYIGSRSAFGVLPAGALEATRVDTGRTLAEHMAQCGANPDAVSRGEASLSAKSVRAFVELHIEQAPQLVEAGVAIGIGTGVPGNFRYPNLKILGEYAHVGLPRRFRRDAVLAASQFAIGLDQIWRQSDAAGRPMAFTIGRFHTDPQQHALTKVAGELRLSLDVRAYSSAHLAELEAAVLELARQIANERGVRFEFGTRAGAEVAPSNPELVARLTGCAQALGIATMPLASPASHDTATFTVAGVPSAMLFVRNANGSHNPREAMELDDFLDGAAILTRWLVAEATAEGIAG